MRIVVQRSGAANVSVDGVVHGEIAFGLVLLVGIEHEDSDADLRYLAEKVAHLRVFEDADGRMNRSVLDVGGAVLSISQFTLLGDVRKGRRPNFGLAAPPEHSKPLYEQFNELLRSFGLRVETGVFGAMMQVSLVNNGPVTILLDSRRQF